MTSASTHHSPGSDSQEAVWERWWSDVNDSPGEVVWDAAASDLAADLEVFGDWFDPDLPVLDLGCGDGRQTRFLAQHFKTVIRVDISPSAIRHAAGARTRRTSPTACSTYRHRSRPSG
jgi:SAM-dependent methyltransferase